MTVGRRTTATPAEDPATSVAALGRTLADVHDGRLVGPDVGRLSALSAADALGRVELALATGAALSLEGTPFDRMGPGRLVEALRSGVASVVQRCSTTVPTVGRATIGNLDLAGMAASSPELSGSPNLVFRPGRRSAGGAAFRDWGQAALADPYRDLAVAAADVVATVGAAGVLALTEAYVAARPSIEPLDLIRLDWWSMLAALESGR